MRVLEYDSLIFLPDKPDIKSWFQRSKVFKLETASSADIQKLEKSIDIELPKILKIMLLETSGTLWFMEKEALSSSRIQVLVSKLEGMVFLIAGLTICAIDIIMFNFLWL